MGHCRGEAGDLRLGIRRAARPRNGLPDSIIMKQNPYPNVLFPVANALSSNGTFNVFYSPRYCNALSYFFWRILIGPWNSWLVVILDLMILIFLSPKVTWHFILVYWMVISLSCASWLELHIQEHYVAGQVILILLSPTKDIWNVPPLRYLWGWDSRWDLTWMILQIEGPKKFK